MMTGVDSLPEPVAAEDSTSARSKPKDASLLLSPAAASSSAPEHAAPTSGTQSLELAARPPQRHKRGWCDRISWPVSCLVLIGCLEVGYLFEATLFESRRPSDLETLQLPLPSNDTELTFFAYGSCSNQVLDLRFWKTILPLSPQLFYFNGDVIYGDCHGSLTPGAETCPQLEEAWQALFANSNFAEAARAVPMTGMLDDHDYGENDAGLSNKYKYYSKAEFLRRFGVPAGDPRWHRPGLYTSSVHGPAGRRVQLIHLDTRYSRSALRHSGCRAPQICHTRERYLPYSANESSAYTVLGEEQWRWLESELRRPAELRLLFTSVQVLAVGHGWERWGNVPSEVSRLFSLIRSTGASGVVLVSGDRHQAGVYAADAGDGGAHPSPFGSPPYTLHELTSSSLTHSHRSDDDGFTEPDVARIGSLLHQNNFGTVAIDWARRTVTLDIRTSDECGLSAQPWDAECEGEPGARANEVLASLTLQIDQLSASSAQI